MFGKKFNLEEVEQRVRGWEARINTAKGFLSEVRKLNKNASELATQKAGLVSQLQSVNEQEKVNQSVTKATIDELKEVI
jgi:hypothetical protein